MKTARIVQAGPPIDGVRSQLLEKRRAFDGHSVVEVGMALRMPFGMLERHRLSSPAALAVCSSGADAPASK